MAASFTVRAIGPAVSCEYETGISPARLRSPTVGLMPTMLFALDGQAIEPSVSTPIAATARLDAIDDAAPELEPHAVRSSTYGLRLKPPRALQPLVERVDLTLDHSLRFVLPRMIAPASRSLAAMNASFRANDPMSASEPAVVCMRSPVSTTSFTSTGTP